MNGKITYRKANKKEFSGCLSDCLGQPETPVITDIGSVTDLLCKLYEMPRDELLTENERDLSDAGMAFFMAFDGEKPVGVAHVSLRREYVNGAGEGVKGYLEAVYVLPEYRLNGIANALVKSAEHWAASNGCREFASDCLLENTDSYHFHLKIGFKETERNIFFLKSIEPLVFNIVEIDAPLRKTIQPMLNEHWGGPELALNGKVWDTRTMPGLAAVGEGGDVFGYLLYEFHDGLCEIMVLESLIQHIGVASALIEALKKLAKQMGVGTMIVLTTNDNTHAIRFYQRRGFTIRVVRVNALEAARRLKPAIPLIGEEGIPLRDEIEFGIEI